MRRIVAVLAAVWLLLPGAASAWAQAPSGPNAIRDAAEVMARAVATYSAGGLWACAGGPAASADLTIIFVDGGIPKSDIGSGFPLTWTDVTISGAVHGCEGQTSTLQGESGDLTGQLSRARMHMDVLHGASFHADIPMQEGGVPVFDATIDLTWSAVGTPIETRPGMAQWEAPATARGTIVLRGLALPVPSIRFDGAASDAVLHWWLGTPYQRPSVWYERLFRYVVRPGDSLWDIARRDGVTLQAVVDANPQIVDPRLIHPDDWITVPRCTVPAVAPTGWWTGDQTGADRAGAPPATFVGDARYGRGLVGSSFVLGGAGDYVRVADDPTLQVTNRRFTVDAWVRFDTTVGEQVLVEKWVQHLDGTPSSGWTLTKLSTNVIRLELAGGSRVDTPPLRLYPGIWYNVAARLDGTQMTVFVNGQPTASGTTDASFSGDLSSSASLKFGHRGNPQDTPGSQDARQFFLHGAIDEVAVWVGTALSDQDLEAIAAAAPGGICRR